MARVYKVFIGHLQYYALDIKILQSLLENCGYLYVQFEEAYPRSRQSVTGGKSHEAERLAKTGLGDQP